MLAKPSPAISAAVRGERRRDGDGTEGCCSYSQDGLQDTPSTTGVVHATKMRARKA